MSVNLTAQSDYWQITGDETQEIRMLLGTLIDRAPVEQSESPIVITVSFPWENKIQFESFSNKDCPGELRQVFEILDAGSKRIGRVGEWIPCGN